MEVKYEQSAHGRKMELILIVAMSSWQQLAGVITNVPGSAVGVFFFFCGDAWDACT